MIKTRFEKAKGIWLDELPEFLWAYRTMAHTPTGETHFHLAYGYKAVIPVEVEQTSYQGCHHDERRNEEGMRLQLNLLDEVKATAEQRVARY